jgi:hypothetical protein
MAEKRICSECGKEMKAGYCINNGIKVYRKQLLVIANSEKSTPTERTLAKLLIEERDKISEVVNEKNRLYGMMYKCWLFMENDGRTREKRKKELEGEAERIKLIINGLDECKTGNR